MLITKEAVAIIKESYVKITGNLGEAAVLNQMVYWSERTKDAAAAKREDTLCENEYTQENLPSFGWIYKTAEELSGEIMIGSMRTVARRLDSLVKKGFIIRRRNPKFRYDHTYQYRVNTRFLKRKLKEVNFTESDVDKSAGQITETATKNETGKSVEKKPQTPVRPICQIGKTICQNGNSKRQSDNSISQIDRTIPETTSNTTAYITPDMQKPPSCSKGFSQTVGQRPYAKKQNKYYKATKNASKPSFDIDKYIKLSMLQLYAETD